MSQLVGNHCSEGLSYASKELGCHAFEKFLNKLKNKGINRLINCFQSFV